MPLYDVSCPGGHETLDVMAKVGENPPCPVCGEPTFHIWRSFGSVVADEIPGGVEIRHGICNEDGSPTRYYSKSEMARAAKEKGLINAVRHVTAPGTDKSPHTVKWTAAPAILTPADQARHTQEWWDDEERRNPSLRREDFGVTRA